MKEDLTKSFINETFNTSPRKNYPTNKTVNNHINEIWSIDLADLSDFKQSSNKRFMYIFIIFDNFSINTWCVLLKNEIAQTKTNDFQIF